MRTASASSAAAAARRLPATRISRCRLQMGTLSKAVGAYGGYLCASAAVIDLMRNRARTLIYSTGLPPAIVAASHRRARSDRARAGLCARPVQKAKVFTHAGGVPGSAKPDRAGDGGRGTGGARGLAPARRGRLPRRRHPPAHGAGRHRAPAADLHGAASRRCRSSGWQTSCATRYWCTNPCRPISSPPPAPISARPSSPPG